MTSSALHTVQFSRHAGTASEQPIQVFEHGHRSERWPLREVPEEPASRPPTDMARRWLTPSSNGSDQASWAARIEHAEQAEQAEHAGPMTLPQSLLVTAASPAGELADDNIPTRVAGEVGDSAPAVVTPLAPGHPIPDPSWRASHRRGRSGFRLLPPLVATAAVAACFGLPFVEIDASTLELSFQITLLVTFGLAWWLHFQLSAPGYEPRPAAPEGAAPSSLSSLHQPSPPPLSPPPRPVPLRVVPPPLPPSSPSSPSPASSASSRAPSPTPVPASAPRAPVDRSSDSTPTPEPGHGAGDSSPVADPELESRPDEPDSEPDSVDQPGLGRVLALVGPGGEERIGQQVGSYRLEQMIGRGGMGEVYKGRNVRTGEIAAIKLLRPALVDNPSATARFLREVRLAASLDAPNVIRVLEVGSTGCPEPYLAMEYLEGKSLAEYLTTRPRLTLRQAARMLEQLSQGIHAAGLAGIVHRDLKPQNVFLAKQDNGRPIWKILDFGASTLSSGSGTLTQGRVIGTPAYMAPEQARGRTVDHRTDLYALAAIVYRALTGRSPFCGHGVPSILHDVVFEMPRRPGEVVDLPADVDAMLAIGLAKDPDSRFPSARDLCEAFEAAIAGKLPRSLRQHAEELLAVHPWPE